MGWTTIDGNTSWQELAIAQEIATAFNARALAFRSIMGYSTPAAISPDDDMTVFDFVYAVQYGVEFMAQELWCDPDATLAGQDAVIAPYGSTAAFMTAAGLTQEGYWRRVPEGDSAPNPWGSYTGSGWLYGKITDKDLAGPWLFKDLQTALAKMTRVVTYAGWVNGFWCQAFGSGQSEPPYPAGVPPYNYYGTGFLLSAYKDTVVYSEDPSSYGYNIELSYVPRSFSNQPTVAKAVSVIGIPYCRTSTEDGNTGYAEVTDQPVYGFTPGITQLFDYFETDAAAFEIAALKQDTWAFLDVVPWPEPVIPEGWNSNWGRNEAHVSVDTPMAVIDYAFDP